MTLVEIDALNAYSRKANRNAYAKTRSIFDAEILHGQWCGPDYAAAERMHAELIAPHALWEGPADARRLTALGESVCAKARETAAKRRRRSVFGAV